ncbi:MULTISPECIES: sensor histidine kinase [Flavobacteriaceae]|uniref:sensor histidine kinase n=1 Tax=Flavobacteriaceae TaxID=49546 RepID=UPI0004DFA12E|nr:HAMP domain-containing sensor histidine kinase [Flavimarina sp. Hel_I_48]MEC7785217.1 HAMP domain-containing sensor histidine kinase [Bacteroidota bacterium]
MKLLDYTSRIQMFLFFLLFGIFSILFYFVLSWNVLRNIDEILYNRKTHLLAFLKENPQIPFEENNPLDDFTFFPIEGPAYEKGRETYTDTLVFEDVDDEFDEYRKLTSFVALNGKPYRLEIEKPHLEATEIIGTISITLGGLFLGMAVCFYMSQRYISKKIWKPFHEMLEKLRHFRLDERQLPELSNSRIDEFQMLNGAVKELARKNMDVFESQKQFIENASHEMQTPLSIIQSRLEALIGQAELTEEQAVILEGIISSTQRLKKLNKTLLLLSKIENRQFILTEEVNLGRMVDRLLDYYSEQKRAMNIEVQVDCPENFIVRGNTMLTEILVQNLLKNAFLHNIKNGAIGITATDHANASRNGRKGKGKLVIANTGPFPLKSAGDAQMKLDTERVFERFYKKSGNPDTWGLGLAIASKITDTCNWHISYSYKMKRHVFEVDF